MLNCDWSALVPASRSSRHWSWVSRWPLPTFCLAYHGARLPDRAAFVTGSFQPFIGDFGPNCGRSLYWEADARPDFYLLAVGAFADSNFPAPSVSIFEESKHTWTQLPDRMKHF